MRVRLGVAEIGSTKGIDMKNYNKKKMMALAEEIARKAHEGQTRWDGIEPYINHPKRVAEQFRDEVSKTVAWLHDVVEDTDTTLDDLRGYGFSQIILDAVDAITRKRGQMYLEYILTVRGNWVARWVKQADIRDNLTDTTSKNHRDKYDMALFILDCQYINS